MGSATNVDLKLLFDKSTSLQESNHSMVKIFRKDFHLFKGKVDN